MTEKDKANVAEIRLQELTTKIQKLIPQIMELKFGCRVKVNHYNNKTAVVASKRLSSKGNIALLFDDEAQSTPCGGWNYDPKHIEILGRDITALDLLKCLPNGWMMKFDSGTQDYEFVYMKDKKNTYFVWGKLNVTLQDLNPKTIQFLYDILI